MYRSHLLNQLSKNEVDETVTLSGWVNRRRDHGGIIFIDLRDRYGITQIVFDPENNPENHQQAEKLKNEFVIQIRGKVRLRPPEMINPKLKTGEIEVLTEEISILSEAKPLPFEIHQEKIINEELRLTYRYLDLRRERLKKNIINRHRIIKFLRDYFDEQGFIEVETPILLKGTPEGSREYIVPSRLHPGKFYVLPQSPQQLKQLLMVAGFDRYFQIARCFRDEDQRGDRQPEFTQLDIEMSFVEVEDVLKVNETGLIEVTEKFLPHKKILFRPFPRLSWKEAMENYGSDKPDIRFEMKITDLSEELKNCGFKIFDQVLEKGQVVKALRIEGGASWTRSEIQECEKIAKTYGASGLASLTLEKEGPKSPILKFFEPKTIEKILEKTAAKTSDLVVFAADTFDVACAVLGQIRLHAARKLKLINDDVLAYLWVTDFPLFEWNEEENKLVSSHHPFTHPKPEDIGLLDNEPQKARALAYDIVMNGVEIGGGSIRIHDPKLQSQIFDILQISKEDADRRFGHLLKAFQYGAPPHGGIAWGLDRLIMIFQNEPNIREVIAYPKDQSARDLMTGAPSILPEKQISEVHIKSLTLVEEGIAVKIRQFLEENHSWFEESDHVSASNNAEMVKSFLLKTESDQYILAVIPEESHINLEKLKKIAKTNRLDLASIEEIAAITECHDGLIPPFGKLFKLPTIIEDSLKNSPEISFSVDSNKKYFKIKSPDFLKIVSPISGNFT